MKPRIEELDFCNFFKVYNEDVPRRKRKKMNAAKEVSHSYPLMLCIRIFYFKLRIPFIVSDVFDSKHNFIPFS